MVMEDSMMTMARRTAITIKIIVNLSFMIIIPVTGNPASLYPHPPPGHDYS
jgi:hypothetical protein